MVEEKRRSRRGCFWFALILSVLMLIVGGMLIAGVVTVGRSFAMPARSAGVGEDEYPNLKEVWAGGEGKTKVVKIALRGLILLDVEEGFFGPRVGSADLALRSIHRATHDADVKAIILDIDSGGGGITASDILYKALLDFKEAQTGRQVVTIMNDVAASGAYYVALASDFIVAHPTTITGSIGVLIQSFNLRELGEKIGIKDVTIKSGANKDMLNPLKDMTDEQRRMLQSVVDELHSRFVALVAESRKLPEEHVRRMADGRIFTAGTAKSAGLVDEIGYWKDAVTQTACLLNVDEVKIYRYEEPISFASLFRASEKGMNPLSQLLSRPPHARLMYLWEM
jgi:protease-4